MQMANFRQILLQKKIDLFFEILSLFNEKTEKYQKVPKGVLEMILPYISKVLRIVFWVK